MTEEDIIRFVSGLPGVDMMTASEGDGAPEAAWGDTFFFYDPTGDEPADRRFPFATIVVSNYEGFDESSDLNRPGVFRLNIAVGRRRFEDLLGYRPSAHPEHAASHRLRRVGQPDSAPGVRLPVVGVDPEPGRGQCRPGAESADPGARQGRRSAPVPAMTPKSAIMPRWPTRKSDAPPTRWELTVTGERWDFYVNTVRPRIRRWHRPRGRGPVRRRAGASPGPGAGRRLWHRPDRRRAAPDGAPRDRRRPGCRPGRRSPSTRYPGPAFVAADLLTLTPEMLGGGGGPGGIDVIVLAGNVMVYLAPGTERQVLSVLSGLLDRRWPDRHRVRHRPRLHRWRSRSGRRRDRAAGGAPVRHLAPGSVVGRCRLGGDSPAAAGVSGRRP